MVNKGMWECENNPFGKTSGRNWNADTKEYRSGVRKAAPEIAALAVCLLLVQTGMLTVLAAPAASVIRSDELRGVWISYLDWEKMPADQEAFKREVDKMLDRCVELKMNAVFVHVRPDADAMYPSSYFPWSRFVTGTQGHNPGYDPFAIFVKTAHSKGLQIHAWVNPYRVTGYHNTWEQVSEQNPKPAPRAGFGAESGEKMADGWRSFQ